ncbi:hypothetical protein P4482_01780 [Neobacillus thermocopriae]|uniref:hypothetical protein n=1 Tax=Neobacillus thermocopriae TaxID=1215031 RepID=UPI002E220873|nr:hypothetical protein [Neobacillus thermocopriae]MED3712951.1 hypothetical protein [Neobacillus thermocopriae]
MYPYYRSPYPASDQRFLGPWGWGLPLAIGGLGFLGGLLGGALVNRPYFVPPFYGYPGYPGPPYYY